MFNVKGLAVYCTAADKVAKN